jgi:diadenosine tetraphosphate (Ap4A) HIT family hydrolase
MAEKQDRIWPHLHVHTIPRSIVDGAGTVDSMFKNKPK